MTKPQDPNFYMGSLGEELQTQNSSPEPQFGSHTPQTLQAKVSCYRVPEPCL